MQQNAKFQLHCKTADGQCRTVVVAWRGQELLFPIYLIIFVLSIRISCGVHTTVEGGPARLCQSVCLEPPVMSCGPFFHFYSFTFPHQVVISKFFFIFFFCQLCHTQHRSWWKLGGECVDSGAPFFFLFKLS